MRIEDYRRALLTEHASLTETGQHERAAQVRAELARHGGLPPEMEDAADRSPRETAVPARRRGAKET